MAMVVEQKRRSAAILSADIVGYSRLMNENEQQTIALLRQWRSEVFEPVIARHKGKISKSMGDGWYVEFDTPTLAAECAIQIQEMISSIDTLNLRIGLHIGDITYADDDIFGDGLNVAARLQELAVPGSILISETVRRGLDKSIAGEFSGLGQKRLKNIASPVGLYGWHISEDQLHRDRRDDAEKPSLAVMPFVNRSKSPDQDYFSDGISEDIITDLSRVSGLFVAARSSSFNFKGQTVGLDQVSVDLDVRYVLEGVIRQSGGRIRISAQLVDCFEGKSVWAERFDRNLGDIFAVQDEIAREIVEALKVRLLPAESRLLGKIPTKDVEAYQYYLRGRQLFNRHTKGSYEAALNMYSAAIGIDPDYSLAYAGIADCYTWLYEFYEESYTIEEVLLASQKALELDSNLAEAHASRGFALALGGNFSAAEQEFETALELDPNLFEAYFFYGRSCFNQGKFERAAKLFQLGSEVRPSDFQSLMLLATSYRALGRKHDELNAQRRSFARADYELQLRPENARAAYAAAMAMLSLGKPERASFYCSRALSTEPDDHLTLYNVACVYSLLGKLDQAIELLVRTNLNRRNGWRDWLKNDSDLDPIRESVRFQAWLQSEE